MFKCLIGHPLNHSYLLSLPSLRSRHGPVPARIRDAIVALDPAAACGAGSAAPIDRSRPRVPRCVNGNTVGDARRERLREADHEPGGIERSRSKATG